MFILLFRTTKRASLARLKRLWIKYIGFCRPIAGGAVQEIFGRWLAVPIDFTSESDRWQEPGSWSRLVEWGAFN